MDLDKIVSDNIYKGEKKRNRYLEIFHDPHLYLMLVILGMMVVMTLVSCAPTLETSKNKVADNLSRAMPTNKGIK